MTQKSKVETPAEIRKISKTPNTISQNTKVAAKQAIAYQESWSKNNSVFRAIFLNFKAVFRGNPQPKIPIITEVSYISLKPLNF